MANLWAMKWRRRRVSDIGTSVQNRHKRYKRNKRTKITRNFLHPYGAWWRSAVTAAFHSREPVLYWRGAIPWFFNVFPWFSPEFFLGFLYSPSPRLCHLYSSVPMGTIGTGPQGDEFGRGKIARGGKEPSVSPPAFGAKKPHGKNLLSLRLYWEFLQ